jgi:hypothetical protein
MTDEMIYLGIKGASTDDDAYEAIDPWLSGLADLHWQDKDTGDTALILAAKKGFIKTAQAILEDDMIPRRAGEFYEPPPPLVDMKNAAGKTALYEAIAAGHFRTAALLLAYAANPYVADVDKLITKKAEKNPTYAKFRDAIHKATGILSEKAYILLGHGSEKAVKMEERWVVPKGVIIVYENQCDQPLWSITGYRKLNEFLASNRKLLNPIRFREELEAAFHLDQIKLYVEGMLAPRVEIEFMNAYSMRQKTYKSAEVPYRKQYYLLKSGVYEFPIKEAAIKPIEVITNSKDDKMGNYIWEGQLKSNYVLIDAETDELETMKKGTRDAFRGAIFPTGDTIDAGLVAATTKEDMLHIFKLKAESPIVANHTLEDLVGRFGPGIYYMTSCRNVACDVKKEAIEAIQAASQEQQMAYETMEKFDELLGAKEIELAKDMDERQAILLGQMGELEAEERARRRVKKARLEAAKLAAELAEKQAKLAGAKRGRNNNENNATNRLNNSRTVKKTNRLTHMRKNLASILTRRKKEQLGLRKSRIHRALYGLNKMGTRKSGKLNSRLRGK